MHALLCDVNRSKGRAPYGLTRSDMALSGQKSHRLADLATLAKVKAGDGPDAEG